MPLLNFVTTVHTFKVCMPNLLCVCFNMLYTYSELVTARSVQHVTWVVVNCEKKHLIIIVKSIGA